MQNVKSLRVYHAAEDLAVEVYGVARALPSDERFALGQQMRRSVVSIGSNIAEGCGRGGTVELCRFLRIALGSATELEFQLAIARRLGFVPAQSATAVIDSCTSLQRMLTRLIVRLRPAPGASRGRPRTDEPMNR
jgi:four helix bundle protein